MSVFFLCWPTSGTLQLTQFDASEESATKAEEILIYLNGQSSIRHEAPIECDIKACTFGRALGR
jgi:hypothetical protein